MAIARNTENITRGQGTRNKDDKDRNGNRIKEKENGNSPALQGARIEESAHQGSGVTEHASRRLTE